MILIIISPLARQSGLNFRKNDSKLNFNLHQVNAKEFSHDLRLEHKCLVNEVKEYEKNAEISNVVNNYNKTKQLYKIGL
ncbi:23361_t:CDS:2 [Dentiscutata erythropus]|uniref:23361_t:CDS:1 n=1 Tax=Dentiscutata erythropus TaxID=1348616 RepID=A0A9N9H6Y4_9GLOM|nr:23361_t:CDS:2 [Dentiscutata erythropus]